MPLVSSGKDSRQDYGTPKEFMTAFARAFGTAGFDLAAHSQNTKAPRYFNRRQNALSKSWHDINLEPGHKLWLNPPFSNIRPWAEKSAAESKLGASIHMLTPASVGSRWHEEFVFGKADTFFLIGRIKFVGAKDPYPRDCMLTVFSPRSLGETFLWNWQDGYMLNPRREKFADVHASILHATNKEAV